MEPVRIAGTGSYTPETVLTNYDLEKMVDTTDEWIVQRTGIRERRLAAANDVDVAIAPQIVGLFTEAQHFAFALHVPPDCPAGVGGLKRGLQHGEGLPA